MSVLLQTIKVEHLDVVQNKVLYNVITSGHSAQKWLFNYHLYYL